MLTKARFILETVFAFFFLALVVVVIAELAAGDYSGLARLLITVPLFVVAVDGGDRVFRHIIETRRQHRLKKVLKQSGQLPPHSFQAFNVHYRLRKSDEMDEFDLKPYRILVAVYNVGSEWKTIIGDLSSVKDKLFVVDDASTDDTFEVVKESGVTVVRNPENTNKPGAILYGLESLPGDVETVVVIDPDVELPSNTILERTIYDFQRSKAAACGLYIVPRRTRKRSTINLCQTLEYELSMYYGKEIPHDFMVISGAASVHDRSTLREALKDSSRSVYAEDFETSLILLSSGERIYFDRRVVVRTRVPRNLKQFTMQRMGWYFSVPKVTFPYLTKVRRCKDPLMRYQFYIYNLFFTLLIHPFRVFSMFILGWSIFAYILGLFIDSMTRYQVMPPYMILGMSIIVFYVYLALEGFVGSVTLKRSDLGVVLWFPLYMIYQVMIPITIGYLNFFTWVLVGRKVIADPYGPKKRIIKRR